MIRFSIYFLLFLMLGLGAAKAQDAPKIIYDRSENEVPLNITFDGQDILIYGAVDDGGEDDLNLIIIITGPLKNYTIRKKEHKLGIWLNRSEMTFRNVPSFLAIFSNAPLDSIMLPTEKQRYRLGFEQAVRIRGIGEDVTNPEEFLDAFIELQQEESTYVLNETGVKISGNLLFSAQIPLAADIIEGDYTVDIYLLNKGRVAASVRSELPVYKSGLERWIYDLAMDHGFFYGLLAIFLAVSIAFIMSQFMRLLKR